MIFILKKIDRNSLTVCLIFGFSSFRVFAKDGLPFGRQRREKRADDEILTTTKEVRKIVILGLSA
jgi:hypothetical protein